MSADTSGDTSREEIWLEVTNVRRKGDTLQVQVKGDRQDREPVWWGVESKKAGYDDHDAAYKAIAEGLDKKRVVLAALKVSADNKTLTCQTFRIQYAESTPR